MNKKVQKIIKKENDLERYIDKESLKLIERLIEKFQKLENDLNFLIQLIENKLERR